MEKSNVTRPVIVVLSLIAFAVLTSGAISLYKKSKENTKLDKIAEEASLLLQPVTGVGSEFDTEQKRKEFSAVAGQVAQMYPEGTPSRYLHELASQESLILGNMTTGEAEKKRIAVNAYNFTHKTYSEVSKGMGEDFQVVIAKSVVAPYQFFEQYCFRPDWFLESDWATDEVFVKSLAKYPNEKTMSIFFAFSEKLAGLPVQDNVVIGNTMRVTSYLLHSYAEKLTPDDKEMLLNRLIALRDAFANAPISRIYGINHQVQQLVVTPSVEFSYATEIVSKYRPDLVPHELVVETYEKNIAKIKLIVDANNRPIYMVNKFMWINLMYLGYLYEYHKGEIIPEVMYPIVIFTLGEYGLGTSEYVEGRESVRSYEAAVNNELGNWDQIRKRAFLAERAIWADKERRLKNGTLDDVISIPTPNPTPLPPQIN